MSFRREQHPDMAGNDDMGLSPLEMFLLQEEEDVETQDGFDSFPLQSQSIMQALVTDLAAPRVVAEAVDAVADAVASAMSLLKSNKALEPLAKLLAVRHGMVVTLRAGLGAHSAAACTSQLRHRFLMVQLHNGGPHVYVDPVFREQFRLGTSLPSYEAMLDASVPAVFVGSHAALEATVLAICHKTQRALEKLRLEVPPWRSASSMVSKWAPRRYADTVFQPMPGTGLLRSGRQAGGSGSSPAKAAFVFAATSEAAGRTAAVPPLSFSPVYRGNGQPSASLLSAALRVIPPQQQGQAAAAARVKAAAGGKEPEPKSVVYGFSVTAKASARPGAAASATPAAALPAATVPDAHALSIEAADEAVRDAAPDAVRDAAPDADSRQGIDQGVHGSTAVAREGGVPFKSLDELLPTIRTIKLGV